MRQLRKNFYIKDMSYIHRMNLPNYADVENSMWQSDTTYFIAAELARRFGARYVIDVGCGKAYKMSKLYPEFIPIGIDFKSNLVYSKRTYPHLKFINLDMGQKNCTPSIFLQLPVHLIEQAVVLSADVIEHIMDPLRCYMDVLRYMSLHAAALIVSTPDRLLMNNSQGPPHNRHHVREWALSEMEMLLSDQSMLPLVGGWICGFFLQCKKGFTPETNSYRSIMVTMGNNKDRITWVRPTNTNFTVTAFVIVHPRTHETILNQQCKHLRSQGVEIILMGQQNYLLNYRQTGIQVILLPTMARIITVLRRILRSLPTNHPNNWYMLIDSHEFITTLRDPYLNSSRTLKEFLSKLNSGQRWYNAVAITTLFMEDSAGRRHRDITPFMIFSEGPWDRGFQKYDEIRFKPNVDTRRNKIKIWRSTNKEVTFSIATTLQLENVITEVYFPGQVIYPYNVIGQRFYMQSPLSDLDIGLSYGLQQMYAYELSLGYITSDRLPIIEKRFLF